MDIDPAIATGERYDVQELLICFAPLMTREAHLPDTTWTLLLSLVGVANVSGMIDDEYNCHMEGIMSTHPPICVSMDLTTRGALYSLKRIKLIASYHVFCPMPSLTKLIVQRPKFGGGTC